jgi:hypothetical protein
MLGFVLFEQGVFAQGEQAFLGHEMALGVEDKLVQEAMKALAPLMRTVLPAGLGLFAKRKESPVLLVQNWMTDAVFLFPVCSHYWFYQRDSG